MSINTVLKLFWYFSILLHCRKCAYICLIFHLEKINYLSPTATQLYYERVVNPGFRVDKKTSTSKKYRFVYESVISYHKMVIRGMKKGKSRRVINQKKKIVRFPSNYFLETKFKQVNEMEKQLAIVNLLQ